MEAWKRNLYVIWVAELVAIAGFSFVFPFLPYYIQELGVTELHEVEMWAGVLMAAQAIPMAIFSPIWGSLADRYGRKIMVERAMFGSALVITAMGFVQNVEQLLILRIIQGTLTGTVAAATTLVASSAPRERAGYAMGLLQTAVWTELSAWPPDGLGQYCHWGATTQDIMDTADVLQLRDALALVDAELDAIGDALATLADQHAETPMAGRTHLQHALPISFGYKCATWLSAIDRHQVRLQQLKPRLLVVQFSGAAGTLASLGKDGLATQAALAEELGLAVPDITWHSIRDAFAETSGLLALIAGSIGKIGFDIMLMMQTEIAEVLEPFVAGWGASSTMPQKRNPIASEMMVAAAKIVREQHSLMLDALVQDHERATGPWHVEWHALPTAFMVTSGGLRGAREALQGLEVRPQAMAHNLGVSQGLIVAEAVMMGLAPRLGRQHAHDIVYACCRTALSEEMSFPDALLAEPQVAAVFQRAEIEFLTNPANYLGSAPKMARALLARRTHSSTDTEEQP